MTKKHITICTALALMSGFFGGFVGFQISMSLQNQRCENKPMGLKQICDLRNAPSFAWNLSQGSTRGLWTGTVLGSFVGGLATQKVRKS